MNVNHEKFQCDSDRCNGLNEAELLDASIPPFTQEPIELPTTTGHTSSETTQASESTTTENQATSSGSSTTKTTINTSTLETTSTTDETDSDGSFARMFLSIVYLLTIMA